MEEMLSLFDYLGKPAGSELGKQVAAAAAVDKIKFNTKYVSNPKYKGDILMYPKTWLDNYFNKTTQNYETDDLLL
jgi:hypothetical protein